MNFQYFYFMKTENKKSNQTCFQNSNLLKMKTVFRKWKQKMKIQTKHTLKFWMKKDWFYISTKSVESYVDLVNIYDLRLKSSYVGWN